MIALLAASVALAAPCPAEQPAVMRLVGVPPVLVSGQAYTVGLESTGAGEVAGRGWELGVFDRTGRGWSARFQTIGFRQAFSVGLTGAPYTISGTYDEVLGSGSCTRVLSESRSIKRVVLGVVDCRRGAVEPRTLVLGCDGVRVRLRGLSWRGWHEAVAIGRTSRGVRVRLSRPEECVALDGFVYTRARVNGRRYVIDCPIAT